MSSLAATQHDLFTPTEQAPPHTHIPDTTTSLFDGCETLEDMADALENRRTPDFEDALAAFNQFIEERRGLQHNNCTQCFYLPDCPQWQSFTTAENCGAFSIDPVRAEV